MKVSSMLFSAAIAGLAVAYCSLYVEYINLQSQLAQLQSSSIHPENPSLQEAAFTKAHQQSETSNSTVNTYSSRNLGKLEQSASFQLQEKNLKTLSEKKYNILFSILRLSGQDRDQIASLLIERERILNSTNIGYLSSESEIKANQENQQALVAQIDNQVSALLEPNEVRKYELLKDSSYEQHQINSFYNELANQHELSEEKRNALLLGKLEQKHTAAALLDVSADEINNASPSDKKILAERFKETLNSYTENYLRIAKENLTEEQFIKLREHEKRQYEEVWQGLINEWMHD